MYGDGAVGGVVNIITQTMKNKILWKCRFGIWFLENGKNPSGNRRSNGEKIFLQASYSGYSSMDWRDRAHHT